MAARKLLQHLSPGHHHHMHIITPAGRVRCARRRAVAIITLHMQCNFIVSSAAYRLNTHVVATRSSSGTCQHTSQKHARSSYYYSSSACSFKAEPPPQKLPHTHRPRQTKHHTLRITYYSAHSLVTTPCRLYSPHSPHGTKLI